MQELTFETLIAVFEQMFGPAVFWALIGVTVVTSIAYIYVLIRDRSISARKFLWAQLVMPFGAVLAVGLVLQSTDSRLADLGGPVDWIVLLGIALGGAVGSAILAYTVQSLVRPPSQSLTK